DQRVPHLRVEGSVHEGTATSHHAVGERVRCRCRAGAPGQKSGCDAYSPRDGRASVWHAEDADGGDALFDENAAEGGDRDGAACARLQPHARDEHRRYQTTHGRDSGLRRCHVVRAVWPFRSSAWPEAAPGLTPDPIQQKWAQPIASRSITPGYLQLLGYEKRFHTAWAHNGHTDTVE